MSNKPSKARAIARHLPVGIPPIELLALGAMLLLACAGGGPGN